MTTFPQVKYAKDLKTGMPVIMLISKTTDIPSGVFMADEIKKYFSGKPGLERDFLEIRTPTQKLFVVKTEKEPEDAGLEKIRRQVARAIENPGDRKSGDWQLFNCTGEIAVAEAALEGLLLTMYSFRKYKTKHKPLEFTVYVNGKQGLLAETVNYCRAVYVCRDMINEPLNALNAEGLSAWFAALGKEAGFNVSVFGKKKIASLGMTGLLTVNRGSVDDPTFTVMEYKHPLAKNEKPLVLVGKGVVFDTGGINLKSYEGIMYMKSDMSGAAAVASVMYAIALSQMPVNVVALVPATDNRLAGNAAVSGDIIKMMNGITVEVLNTDAEGRLILADALEYAKKYDPLLVIDVATLTGAASAALGRNAIAVMGTAEFYAFSLLEVCGFETHERVVRFPLWEDYGKMIESKVADIKNVGGKHAGAITAGKFLERFTDYPWIHLDIAGPAFLEEKDSYRGIGGSGVGVRLLYRFLKKMSLQS
jgi:leucyl aminopeptidase